MAKGKVKWFDNRRGFGFISQETGLDIFVHHTGIKEKGFKTLYEGDIVSYNLITTDKGPKAEPIRNFVFGSGFMVCVAFAAGRAPQQKISRQT